MMKIAIFGSTGTGKTTPGIAILKELNKKVYYILDDARPSQNFDLEAFERARIDYEPVKIPPKPCDCVVYVSHSRFDVKKLLQREYYTVIIEHDYPVPEILDEFDVVYITSPLFCCLNEYRKYLKLGDEELLYLMDSPIGTHIVKRKSL